jgi:hypothetical protein
MCGFSDVLGFWGFLQASIDDDVSDLCFLRLGWGGGCIPLYFSWLPGVGFRGGMRAVGLLFLLSCQRNKLMP